MLSTLRVSASAELKSLPSVTDLITKPLDQTELRRAIEQAGISLED